MSKILKKLVKIILIFFGFYFVLNLAEYLFDMELETYTIVIIFIVVASSSEMFSINKNWK